MPLSLLGFSTSLLYTSRFAKYLAEKEEMDLRPVFSEDGITYVYIKVDTTLGFLSVSRREL